MTRKKLYRQFLKNRETKLCNEKKNNGSETKKKKLWWKKKDSQTNKNYFCTYPKNGKYKFEKKTLDVIKDRVISEGIFNLLPSSNKWTKSLSLNFST